MTQKSELEKMRDTLKWAISIMISLLLILITTATGIGIQTVKNKNDIEKMQNDYLSYSAFQYIVESNNKLINLIASIESKDDQRYQSAIKEWSDLQQEVVKQAGQNKRGGKMSGDSSK